MLGVNLKKWFSAKSCPIGIDLGNDSLKVVQVARENGETRIVAAARRDVPSTVAGDPQAMARFLTESLRDVMASHPFRGKRVVSAVPAEHFFASHLRMARMSEADLAKALPWEAQGKLPFPTRDAVLRHLIAGELMVENEAKTEVILMAAPRPAVERHLGAIARAKLEVESVMVPPLAVIEAFRFLFTRSNEQDMATLFVDIGASQTCAMITHSTKVVFVKQIPVAGHTINAGVATRLDCSRDDAARLRRELAEADARDREIPAESADPSEATAACKLPMAGAVAVSAPVKLTAERAAKLREAAEEQVERLSRELTYCLRYYQSLFPDRPVDRLVFLGGQSHHTAVCQQVARALRLPAMLGDPMLRLHGTHAGVDCGDLTVGTPAPEWAIAFGCSMARTESE
ncbi:MAG: Cell division protein FtsA [Phycisphaerae bacterium]|nr:Cell division protein FtsA [Phycisphaerae bacterium]